MVVNVYDLIVLGDHFGGLAAAALSAKRGKRALLCEDERNPAEDRPLEYLNSVTGGPEREARLGRFFHDLGLSPFGPLGDDRIHFKALHPPLQVILPGHRVNIYQDSVARDWEMEREFGDVQGELAAILEREKALREKLFRFRARSSEEKGSLPARTVGDLSRYFRFQALSREAEGESFARFLSSRELPPALADVLAGEVYGVTRSPAATLPWYVGMRSLQVLQGGLFQNASGQSGVLNGLKEAFLRYGGECLPLSEVRKVETPRAEEAQLSLATGDRVTTKHLLVDHPLEAALSLFPPETEKLLRKKGLTRVAEEYGYGLMTFRLRRGWTPECMGAYMVVDPSAAEGNASQVLLLAGQPREAEGEGEGYAMEVMGVFPVASEPRERREVIWKRLGSLMPFLDRSILEEPAFRSGTFARYSPQKRNWRSAELYYRTGRRTSSFETPGLTFLRNENYLSTGLAEGLLSGIQAAG
jgi:phytoene dehydrogenase-like protein